VIISVTNAPRHHLWCTAGTSGVAQVWDGPGVAEWGPSRGEGPTELRLDASFSGHALPPKNCLLRKR